MELEATQRFRIRDMVDLLISWSRLEEAKRALANMPLHTDCRDGLPCFPGSDEQPPCMRVFQERRIRVLERRTERAVRKLKKYARKKV